jgi:Tol biopolymer transport system component
MPALLHAPYVRARLLAAVVVAVAMMTMLSGCGDDSTSPPVPPLPVATVSIRSIPDQILVGATLTLTADVKAADGTDLNDRAIIRSSDNVSLATVSDDGVMTTHAPGVVAIRATSEGRTGLVDVRIVAPAVSPTIDALSPAQITAGWSLGFTLTITGTGFTPTTRVLWNDEIRETHYISATQLRMPVAPSDVRLARDVAIVVETSGGRATAVFPVRAIPVDRVDVQSPWGVAWTWVNNALPLVAIPRSATGGELTDRRATWTAEAPTIASVVPTGDLSAAIYGLRRGATTVEAVVDGVSSQRTITVYDAPPFDVVFTAGIGPDQYLGLWSPTLGEAPRRLPINLTAFEPSPAPDGRHIVFTGMPKGGSVFDANVDLYVVSRDGSGLRRLTTDDAVDYQPSWSPDGSRIVFTSMRGGQRNVWMMQSDGSNLRRLTDALPGAPHAGSGSSAGDASWSPDGRRLVYAATADNKTSLWVMDSDGGNKRPLTVSMDGNAYDPTWSATGDLIAFRREFGAPPQIALTFVSAADGTTAFPVLTTAPMSATPAFSPDGEWLIASNSPLGNVPSLYAVALNRAGGPRVVLPATLGGARSARWIRRP